MYKKKSKSRSNREPTNPKHPVPTDWFWRGLCIACVLLGVFLTTHGALYSSSWLRNVGVALISAGVIGGSILHLVFGIKIIQLRGDIRHKP